METSVEDEVYDMRDDSDANNSSAFAHEEDSGERSLKRPSASVIVIDDSDTEDSSICHVDSYQATASEAKKLRKGYGSSEQSSSSSSESECDEDLCDVIHSAASGLSSRSRPRPQKHSSSVDIKLNESFKCERVGREFLSCWSDERAFDGENVTLVSEPFQICVLDNFLSNADAIDGIVDDMYTLDWFRKTMDLYEFYRTADLKEFSWQRNIKAVYELLTDEVMKWVARITDTNLTHVSASCALYGPGDYLLTHDDLLEDRKIAFILYLAPWDIPSENNDKHDAPSTDRLNFITGDKGEKGWSKTMGGELQFFASKEGRPTSVVKALLPRNNTFAFFKVNNVSFHQVAEVVSFDFPRLTINGWFHGPVESEEKDDVQKSSDKNILLKPNDEIIETDLKQWISPIYLSPKCKSQILEKFQDTSEISLESYFLETKYDAIVDILQNNDLEWVQRGPVNLKNYQSLALDKLSENDTQLLKNMIEIFTSKHFMKLLKDYTNQSILSYAKLEIQKWEAGCYTVIPVKEEYSVSEVDVTLYLGSPERQLKGGIVTYLDPEKVNADPVISVGQKNNALNIVYSESDTAKFTKYISKLSLNQHEHYYAIVCSYRNIEPN